MCVHSIPTAPILVNEEPLEFVEVLTYLGSLISKDSGASKYIKARLGKAQGAFRQLRPIWRSKQYSLKTKILLFKSNVKFYLLHGSESWRVVKTDMRRMEVFHTNMEYASDEYARSFGQIMSPTMTCPRKREAGAATRSSRTDA